jgi:hypothetical protein
MTEVITMITFNNLVQTIQGAVDQAAESVSRENINGLLEYFHPLTPDEKTESNNGNDNTISIADLEKMSPRMVQLQYPKITKDGPTEHFVSVPLITLSPVPVLQVSDVQVEMDLEIVESDGEIMVGFPQSKQTGESKSSEASTTGGSNAKITLNIKANEKPMGVQSLIEGYNKTLRAQLPN